MAVDYSLYLVTDSTQAILGDRDLVTVVRAALEGGWGMLLCIYILLRLLIISPRRNDRPIPRQD